MVIIPGITSPAITWDSFAAGLGAASEVFVYGVSGRGLSERPPTGYRLADYANEFAGFVAELGLHRPIVIGHSMGARIAAAFAVLFPHAGGPLALIEPPLSGPGRAPYPTTLEQLLAPIRASRAGNALELLRRLNANWSDEDNRVRAEWLATCDETAVAESHRGFHEEDFFEYWPRLGAPLLFVYGQQSPVVRAVDLAELKATNPHAQFKWIADAGHMIPWDNASGLLEQLRSFVRTYEVTVDTQRRSG